MYKAIAMGSSSVRLYTITSRATNARNLNLGTFTMVLEKKLSTGGLGKPFKRPNQCQL